MTMPADQKPKAVVLLSGGLDSTTVLAIAGSQGYECCCLSFQYGQRQQIELAKARKSVASRGITRHLVLNIDLDAIGGSALTSSAWDVPKNRATVDGESEIPVTYVPARNTVFLAYATSWAEVLGARDIFIGVNVLDFSGYPDCRPAFLEAFEKVANLGTRAGVLGENHFKIHAPLLHLNKKEIIERGTALGVDYSCTHSCYDPDGTGRACGACDACRLRLKGFAEAGQKDPAPYQ